MNNDRLLHYSFLRFEEKDCVIAGSANKTSESLAKAKAVKIAFIYFFMARNNQKHL